MFFYREVLHQDLSIPLQVLRARKLKRLPTVLTKGEFQKVFNHLCEIYLLIARMLYGSSLRLIEYLRLQVWETYAGLQHIEV